MWKWSWIGLILFCAACRESNKPSVIVPVFEDSLLYDKSNSTTSLPVLKKGWMLLDSQQFLLDIRYATVNNFTKRIIYDCPACYVRDTLGVILSKINEELKVNYNYQLKILDCYRPLPAQQKLWDQFPDPMYVTNPEKGSMHNRGLAVDVTFADQKGRELDMGTPYDFFGKEAHFDFPFADQKINNNRILLRKTMEKYGLKGIRTEWWHFSLRTPLYPIADWEWECE